jgi:sec-independent protein translocase protein TatA
MGSTGTVYALIGSVGTPEMIVIALVALLLFGGKKIPEIAKGLGEGIRNFKDGMKSDDTKKQ